MMQIPFFGFTVASVAVSFTFYFALYVSNQKLGQTDNTCEGRLKSSKHKILLVNLCMRA